jgi:hypothetical protein
MIAQLNPVALSWRRAPPQHRAVPDTVYHANECIRCGAIDNHVAGSDYQQFLSFCTAEVSSHARPNDSDELGSMMF